MDLVFIYGPAASGKLTIARELAKITGLPVFHNHLVVDTVMAVFEFGSEPFVKLRHEMWISMFRVAAAQRRSLIFTFSPEQTVPAGFVDEACKEIERGGGRVRFVRLLCGQKEQERRIVDRSRAEFGKLRSVEVLRKLRLDGAANYPELPADITIDTEQVGAASAAEQIRDAFGLG